MASETSDIGAEEPVPVASSTDFRADPALIDAGASATESAAAIGLVSGIIAWAVTQQLGAALLMASVTAACALLVVWHRWARPVCDLAMALNRDADSFAGVRAHRGLSRLVLALQRMTATSSRPSDALDSNALDTVARAIRALGRGAMPPSLDELPVAFSSLRASVLRAQEDFDERTRALYQMAVAIVREASSAVVSMRRIASAWTSQKEDLARFAVSAADAAVHLDGFETRNRAAVDSVRAFGQAQRALVSDLRNELLELSRYASKVRDVSARTQSLVEAGDKFDRVFDAATQMTQASGLAVSVDELAAWVGEARAAQATLRTELTTLCFDLDTLAESLRGVSQRQPRSVADIEAQVTLPLVELGDALLLVLEINLGAIRSVSQHADRCCDEAAQIAQCMEALMSRTPRLAASMSQLELGDEFEATVVEDLLRLHRHAEATGSDGLTEDGRQMLQHVQASADQAQMRLGKLLQASDAAVSLTRLG
ncbi:MAG: hypothetical protein AAFN74_09640 [Myxococcota bacterium]